MGQLEVSALPQVPLELHRLGTRVHDRLIDDGFQLPEVKLAGFAPLDTEALAAGLKRLLDRFGEALATLSLERKDADATLFDKTEGVGEFRRTVRFAAGCLASLYSLAGFDDLAAKIRPKRRASRRANGGDPAVADDASGGPDASGGTDESEGEGEASADPARSGGGSSTGETSGPIGIVR